MLLIFDEKFTMSGSPFRIVAFGDQIAYKYSLMIFFIYYEPYSLFFSIFAKRYPVCVLNIF